MNMIKKILNKKCPLCGDLSLGVSHGYIYCYSSSRCQYTNNPYINNKGENNEMQKMQKKNGNNRMSSIKK